MIKSRSRSYSWNDPNESLDEARNTTGLDYLQGILEGNIAGPPILDTVDFQILSVEKGHVVCEFHPKEFHYNPVGSVHGGIITTILDSAIGLSLLSTLPKGYTFTTLELKVNFIRKMTKETPALKTKTKIIHQGNTTALLESDLLDIQGKIYAHAVSTCLILQIP